MAHDITYVGFDGLTYKKADDGTIMVYGKATGPDLDLDQQICDAEWLKTAMPQWMATGANVREQHSNIAAGVGIELSSEGNDWMLKSEVVDPVTVKKVERGVLKGYSIGIKGARIVKDESAPQGRIVAGQIVEVSLVDRPANPTATVEIAKSFDGGDLQFVTKGIDIEPLIPDTQRGHGPTVIADEVSVIEPAYSPEVDGDQVLLCDVCNGLGTTADTNETCVACGGTGKAGVVDQNEEAALSETVDLSVEADVVKSEETPATESRIPAIAEALKSLASTDVEKMEHDPAQLNAVRASLIALIKAELDEMAAGEDNEIGDVAHLLAALDIFLCWWDGEADENETTEPFASSEMESQGDDTMAYIGLGVSADLIKSATLDDATEETKNELRMEIRKALGVDEEIATYKAIIAETEKSVTALKSALDEVREMATPGGPVLRATQAQVAKSADAERLQAEAARFRALSEQVTEPSLKNGYMAKAIEAEADAKRILRG